MFNHYVHWWHQLDYTKIYNMYFKMVVRDNVDTIILHHLECATVYEEMCVCSMLCPSLCNVLHSCFGQTPLQYLSLVDAHVYHQFTGLYR